MNEIRALFIESRLGNFGGLELGLEIQIRLGIVIWREINNQVVINEGVWWELIMMR